MRQLKVLPFLFLFIFPAYSAELIAEYDLKQTSVFSASDSQPYESRFDRLENQILAAHQFENKPVYWMKDCNLIDVFDADKPDFRQSNHVDSVVGYYKIVGHELVVKAIVNTKFIYTDEQFMRKYLEAVGKQGVLDGIGWYDLVNNAQGELSYDIETDKPITWCPLTMSEQKIVVLANVALQKPK